MEIHEVYDGKTERMLLLSLTFDPVVLGQIYSQFVQRKRKDLFQSKHSNVYARWCFDHWSKYSKPPGQSIIPIFQSWAKHKDESTVEAVEKLIQALSLESSTESLQESLLSSDHVLDLANDYLNQIALQKAILEASGYVLTGQNREAQKVLQSYNKINIGQSRAINVYEDQDAVSDVFTAEDELLIHYDGAMKIFFRGAFSRNSLVAFMGADKSGKSFWLSEIAHRASIQGKKVAYFCIGDMTVRDVMTRFCSRWAQKPFEREFDKNDWPKTVYYPTFIEPPEQSSGNVSVDVEQRVFLGPMTHKDARLAREEMEYAHSGTLKLCCFPSGTVNVRDLNQELENWKIAEDFVPSTIVIDYADNLAPINRQDEFRLQIARTWEELSKLRMERHCCVVTATQCDADGYDRKLLSKKNFSNSKALNAHATDIVGINCTPSEIDAGIRRLNWIVRRHGRFDSSKCVYVAGCYDFAMPYVVAALPKWWHENKNYSL